MLNVSILECHWICKMHLEKYDKVQKEPINCPHSRLYLDSSYYYHYCISVFLYFAHWSNTNYEIDYMELISTKAGDVHVQSYGPNLTITSCPSHTELLWRTRPCPRWCRCPGRPSGGCSGGRHLGGTETPPPPPVCPAHLPLDRQDSYCHYHWTSPFFYRMSSHTQDSSLLYVLNTQRATRWRVKTHQCIGP